MDAAGSLALLVAKLHKLSGRGTSSPERLVDTDAHDVVYRLLVTAATDGLATSPSWLRLVSVADPVAEQALECMEQLFAAGAETTGSMMAGRAEQALGELATK